MNALEVAEKIKSNREWRVAYEKIINGETADDRLEAHKEFEQKFGINLNSGLGIYVKAFLQK
ncbi:hypothetical protein ACYSNR_01000 [Enterococcus sp. LJL128]